MDTMQSIRMVSGEAPEKSEYERITRTRISYWKTIALLVLGFVILAVFLLSVDVEGVAGVLSKTNPVIYSLAFISVSVGILFYALAWSALLNSFGNPPNFLAANSMTLASIFINFLVPTGSVGGEVARAYLLAENSDIEFSKGIATVLAHRIIAILPFTLCAVLGLAGLLITNPVYIPTSWAVIAWGAASGSFALLGVVAYFLYNFEKAKKTFLWVIDALTKIVRKQDWKENLKVRREKAVEAFNSFEAAVKVMVGNKSNLVKSVLYAFVSWFFDALVALFVFQALNHPVDIWIIFVVYAIGMIVQLFPLGIPGSIGVSEGVMCVLYASAGVPSETALSAALLIRIPMYWFLLLLGAIATFRLVHGIPQARCKDNLTASVNLFQKKERAPPKVPSSSSFSLQP